MHIETAKPFARGVKTLMYVGDVPGTTPNPVNVDEVAIGALAVLVALSSKGLVRAAAAGIGAWAAYRAYSSR
jgi:hypothetical protein